MYTLMVIDDDESIGNMEQSCKIVEEKRQIIKQLINTEVEE